MRKLIHHEWLRLRRSYTKWSCGASEGRTVLRGEQYPRRDPMPRRFPSLRTSHDLAPFSPPKTHQERRRRGHHRPRRRRRLWPRRLRARPARPGGGSVRAHGRRAGADLSGGVGGPPRRSPPAARRGRPRPANGGVAAGLGGEDAGHGGLGEWPPGVPAGAGRRG